MIEQRSRILFNAMRTPDGTFIVSRHRHEYVTHIDKNGKWYMVDGGLDYIRCSIQSDQVSITLTDADPFEDIRLVFGRFSKGKNFDQPLKYVVLADMSNDHIESVLDWYAMNSRYPFEYKDIFEEELRYRAENSIFIAD